MTKSLQKWVAHYQEDPFYLSCKFHYNLSMSSGLGVVLRQASFLLLDAKVERSDIAGMEENLHPVARSFSNQSFQATAGRSQNRLEPKTSSENFRHNPEMSDLSTLASKSKDSCVEPSIERNRSGYG